MDKNAPSQSAYRAGNPGFSRFVCIAAAAFVLLIAVLMIATGSHNSRVKKAEEAKLTSVPATQTTVPVTQNLSPTASYAQLKSATKITVSETNWELTLVNTFYRVDASYTPDLATVLDDSDEQMDSRVAPHFTEMFNAAAQEGLYLSPCSGYRSYERQQENFDETKAAYMAEGMSEEEAAVKTATEIMPAGSSEHNLGLCMDLVWVNEQFEESDEFAWLQKHAAEYGFILRYPKGKEKYTKVTYEPWHWRYVGVENAKKIVESGKTLEEYLGKVQ